MGQGRGNAAGGCVSVTVTPSLSDVYASLRAFLLQFIVPTGTEVVQGQDNRVPQARAGHVVMQAIVQSRTSTNVHSYNAVDLQTIQNFVQLRLQLDFYGAAAYEWGQAASTLLRDAIACDSLSPVCQPLHADDAVLAPLVTGEHQYLRRATLEVFLQWNPVVTVPQQYADTLSAILVNTDVEFPPA